MLLNMALCLILHYTTERCGSATEFGTYNLKIVGSNPVTWALSFLKGKRGIVIMKICKIYFLITNVYNVG